MKIDPEPFHSEVEGGEYYRKIQVNYRKKNLPLEFINLRQLLWRKLL